MKLVSTAAFALFYILMQQPATHATQEDRTWTGKVFSDRRQALRNAGIKVHWLRLRDDSVWDGKPFAKSRVKTTSDGLYKIVIPKKYLNDDSVVLQITVSKAGFLTRTLGPIAPRHLLGGKKTTAGTWVGVSTKAFKEIQLQRGRAYSGRVLLPDGSPAVGAEVIVATKYRSYSWKFPDMNHYQSVSTAVTDRDGRYELLGDHNATMRVRLLGQAEYLNTTLPGIQPENADSTTIDVRLPKSIRPFGTVTDSNGVAIPFAVVRCGRKTKWDEHNMPLQLERFTVADHAGRFRMPALPKGAYTLTCSGRLPNKNQRDKYRQDGSSGAMLFGGTYDFERLNTVILPLDLQLTDEQPTPRVDLQGVPTNTITVAVTCDQSAARTSRARSIPVTGILNGKRWSGYSQPAKAGEAVFRVPSGLENIEIKTGPAIIDTPGDKEPRQTDRFHINRIDQDLDGYSVYYPTLATLKVKITKPPKLSIKKAGVLSVFLTKRRSVEKSTRKSFGSTNIRGNVSNVRLTAVPGIQYWLHIRTGDKQLHRQEVTLKPGEVRDLDIDLTK